jgi:putative aldouronate transport system substrate-binding protein
MTGDDRTLATATQTYSRRALLRGALGLAGAAALAACGAEGGTPAAGTTPPAGGGANPTATTAAAPRPTPAATAAATAGATRTATAGGSPAAADADGKIPGGAPGVPDVYTKRPAPFKSVAGPPGRGGRVATMEILYGSPPASREQNQYWQYFEKLLNVNPYDANFVPAPAYAEKFSAIVASGDLPDLTWVDYGQTPTVARLFQQNAFADLTPYLSGDALKEFGNLAAFPPQLWKNAAVNKKIFGVPRPRNIPGSTLMFRRDWAAKLGAPRPGNADEFARLVVGMTKNDPDGNGAADTWGLTATAPRPDFNVGFFSQLFRAPNGWRRNPDGSLTRTFETGEYKEAMALARRLFEAGAYHPDAQNMSIAQAKDAFNSGKVGGYSDGITALPGTGGLRAKAKGVNPAAEAVGLAPFGHDGGAAAYHNSQGFFGQVAIPARAGRDRERVRELLRIVDYLARPFGSEESIALAGIEGVHYTVDAGGERVDTELGKAEKPSLGGIMNAPTVYYAPPDGSDRGDALFMQALVRELLAVGVDDPTWGLYSATGANKGAELEQFFADRRLAMITGREPLGGFDQMLAEWRGRGGDQIRKELEEQLAAG